MMAIGRNKIFAHHLEMRHYTRKKLKENGFELFVDDSIASPTLTSIPLPSGNDGSAWIKKMREDYKVAIVGGMGEAKGKILRIAHMGYAVRKEEIDEAVEALKLVSSITY
jgi:aspartate aminotransferase-like enzyme